RVDAREELCRAALASADHDVAAVVGAGRLAAHATEAVPLAPPDQGTRVREQAGLVGRQQPAVEAQVGEFAVETPVAREFVVDLDGERGHAAEPPEQNRASARARR